VIRGTDEGINMTEQLAEAPTAQKLELRRDVTVWGSYMWGYADVGADIYAAGRKSRSTC